jgi:hypothetical protein
MYYTNEGFDVTKRIEKKQTIFIKGTTREEEKEAHSIARSENSYYYDVLEENKKTGRRKHVGYGIPK